MVVELWKCQPALFTNSTDTLSRGILCPSLHAFKLFSCSRCMKSRQRIKHKQPVSKSLMDFPVRTLQAARWRCEQTAQLPRLVSAVSRPSQRLTRVTHTSAVVLALLIDLAVKTGTIFHLFPLHIPRCSGQWWLSQEDLARLWTHRSTLFTCCCAVHREVAACTHYAAGPARVCFRGM